MPRDTQGTYTLPAGTLVEAGDTVLVSQHNPPMEDIQQALTNSLSRDGQGGMREDLPMGGNKIVNLAPGVDPTDAATVSQISSAVVSSVRAIDGSAGAPSISFAADTDTGFYRSAAGTITYVSNGGVVWGSGPTSFGIGTSPSSARLTVQTDTGFSGNGMHIYHYAQQTDPTNQTSPIAVHNYTDGNSFIVDTVGSGASLRLKQANNAAARADKPSNYVGTGIFLELQRFKNNSSGPWPDGNIGGHNDRLTFFNPYGNLCFYGTDATDWDGTHQKAPIQVGTYEHFLNRKLYFGYNNTLNKSIIGSIDVDAGAFTFLDIAALALRPIGDNVVGLGAQSLRFTAAYALEFHPGSGAAIWTSGTGTPEGNITAPVGSLFTRTDGGANTTLYVKESGSGNTGWIAK